MKAKTTTLISSVSNVKFRLREAALHVVIIDCRPPAPGIVSDGWRILDRPRMAAVIIRLTRINLTDPVEALVVITIATTLALGNKNVTAIVIIGVVEKPESCKPDLLIAQSQTFSLRDQRWQRRSVLVPTSTNNDVKVCLCRSRSR